MKGIYNYKWDCRRMGTVESTFIATEAEVQAIVGKQVNFGEILGKHSEIYGEIEESEITLVSQNPEAIKIVESLDILPTGHNPFWYLNCHDCGGTYDVMKHYFDEDNNPICEDCKKEYHSGDDK